MKASGFQQARADAQLAVEPVEKVPKHIFGGDAEKSDFIECTTINDLTFGKGQATPEISVKTAKVTFSTGSFGIKRIKGDKDGRRSRRFTISLHNN
ncbi:hypothetical protein D4S03_10230 [bacterium]|nr:MAG: hypothetical protein D4S03_10230 [bacterium]